MSFVHKKMKMSFWAFGIAAIAIAAFTIFLLFSGVFSYAGIGIGSGNEIFRGPYLQLSDSSRGVVSVVWETMYPSRGEMYYWTSLIDTKKLVSNELGTRHVINLEGLDSSKKYFYRVYSGNRFSRKYKLNPFPSDKNKFSFLVYGDSRHNHSAHQKLVDWMKKYNGDFIIHTGDFVDKGGASDDWDIFFFVLRPIAASMVLFPTIGNHDYDSSGSNVFRNIFLVPGGSPNPGLDYFFDTANARFIVLENRFAGKQGGVQKKWLENLLEDANKKSFDYIFIIIHQGIWSSGPHGADSKLEKLGYIELLKKWQVTAVIAGHDHFYERGEREGIPYIVSGGGGAPIYSKIKNTQWSQFRFTGRHFIKFDIDGKKMKFEVISDEGKKVEECSVGGENLSSKKWSCKQGKIKDGIVFQ